LDIRFPDEKIHTADSQQDCILILRQITSQKLRDIHYRENRAHILAESSEFEVNQDSVSFLINVPN